MKAPIPGYVKTPIVLLLVSLLFALYESPGHAAPYPSLSQQHRQYSTTPTEEASPTQEASGSYRPTGGEVDSTASEESTAMPLAVTSEESSEIRTDPASEDLPPSAPVNPLEIIGAAALLLFLLIEGLRRQRQRGTAR